MAETYREKGHRYCLKHINRELNFLCDDCKTPICDICVSTEHHGHKSTSVSLITQHKIDFIHKFNQKHETETIPQIDKHTKDADDVTKEMQTFVGKEVNEVNAHRRFWKNKIDSLADGAVTHLNNHRDKYLESFRIFKLESEKFRQELVDVKENIKATQSDNNILLVDTVQELKVKTFPNLLGFETPPKIKFSAGTDVESLQQEIFGCITQVSRSPKSVNKEAAARPKKNVQARRSADVSKIYTKQPKQTSHGVFKLNTTSTQSSQAYPDTSKLDTTPNQVSGENLDPSEFKTTTTQASLVFPDAYELAATPSQSRPASSYVAFPPRPTVTAVTELSFEPSSIAVTEDGTLWMCKALNKILYFINKQGYINELTLTGRYGSIDELFVDITVHHQSDTLYCLLLNTSCKSICTVDRRTGRLTHLFHVEDKPLVQYQCAITMATTCIGVSGSGNILVGFFSDYNNDLVSYLIRSKDTNAVAVYTPEGQRLQTIRCSGRPRHISVCHNTGMIAVSCWEYGVLFLDRDIKEVHTYKDTSITDSVFDKYGHVLVLDNEGKVNILNAVTRQHLQTYELPNLVNGQCMATKQNGDVEVVGTSNTRWEQRRLLTFKYIK